VYFPVLFSFVSREICWEDYRYSHDSFHVEGFTLQRQVFEELFIVLISFCIFAIRNIYKLLVNFSFYCKILFKDTAESAVKSQSINH